MGTALLMTESASTDAKKRILYATLAAHWHFIVWTGGLIRRLRRGPEAAGVATSCHLLAEPSPISGHLAGTGVQGSSCIGQFAYCDRSLSIRRGRFKARPFPHSCAPFSRSSFWNTCGTLESMESSRYRYVSVNCCRRAQRGWMAGMGLLCVSNYLTCVLEGMKIRRKALQDT